MDKNQLVRRIAKKHGLYMSHVKEYLNMIFEEIITVMEEDECVKIRGFGTFTPFNMEEKNGMLNGKEFYAAPYKVIRFRTGSIVKDRLKQSCRGMSGAEETIQERTVQDELVQGELEDNVEWIPEPELLQQLALRCIYI